MGRGKFRKGGRGGNRGGGHNNRGNRGPQVDNRVSFAEVPKVNEKFERYYNTINIVPEGPEREAFWTAYRRELPNAFRFTGSRGHAQTVRKNLTERFFPILEKIQHDGKPVELPKQMPWYPDGLAYSMTTPKNVIRKYEPFKEFQKFLVSETGVGNISRQEQVSMIPPLLLDVQPHHTVLDLCAAPGSKSAQLIEAIHAGEEERVAQAIAAAKEGSTNTSEDYGRSTGLLVANDVNYSRAQMLIHQVKRLNSPNIIVTNHDATMFPSIALPPITTADSSKPPPGRYLKFDRILADVPCSGDGTARKNPNVWKDWTPVNALGLYLTQVRILVRSLQMLKAGGRVVYSTCSLNPLEDEAVVASAIERCGGTEKVKLIDCSDQLPELKRVHGLTDWSIMAKSGQIYESWEEAQQYEPDNNKVKVVPGMFPPDARESIPLERCMRVYPHMQDTGGFFIAVLEKQSELRAKPEADSKCANRDWKFDATELAPVTALVNEMQQAPTDGSGHAAVRLETAEKLAPAPEATTEVSAAERSNEPVVTPALKRKLEDTTFDENGVKRTKTEDDQTNDIEAQPHEHLPLPPSVQQGLEGSGEQKTQANGSPAATSQAKPNKPGRGEQAAGEAFKYLSPTHPELERIYDFYQIHSAFPRDRFLVRNHAGDPVKGIYYTSQLAKEILLQNESRDMKFVHAGVKMFMKQDAQGQENVCRWRIQTEGLPIIEGWVGPERTVKLWRRSTLRKLLVEMFPRLGGEEGKEGWRQLGEIGEQVKDKVMGCCVLRVEARKDGQIQDDGGFDEPVVMPLWRSLHSLNLMLPKEERRALLLRVFNEDVELVNNSQPRQSDADATSSKSATKDTNGVKAVSDTAVAAENEDEADENESHD
ncbi:hypothetical protein AMS68_003233 [Peltaster fructicola]|uniref:SAM-dependent MTase RsmB/NOP-type domain-containing protein n=1 Tax=Peltaster fructicola TaxID=286661 RepID=A0A6H0XSR1_9PEZI|nr:hypothetical protein AMS68_003233 [Peltaster fructicola]